MKIAPLFRPRTIWLPTRWGIVFLFAVGLALTIMLWLCVEPFLAVTSRIAADVLVVEGWVGKEGMEAAVAEFKSGSYRVVVATGGFNSTQQFSFAETAQRELLRLGIPPDKLILAKAPNVAKQRTYASAVAVRLELEKQQFHPAGLNVFTLGPHSRRSWIVYAKTADCPVGVISWVPLRDRNVRWWDSSDRIKDLLAESCGYLFERFFNSGRLTNRTETPGQRGPIARSLESATARR